jgi:hypothetical protein
MALPFGETATQSENESLRLRRSTEARWPFTFCVLRGQRESSSIVARLTGLSIHRKVSVERLRHNKTVKTVVNRIRRA